MPEIRAFRGLRYDLGHVGSLGDVIAPPYDVIDSELQQALYKQHPANVVRLILNRDEPGDDDQSNRYIRAARFLRRWQQEGVLYSEPDPAIYVYHQEFTMEGQRILRRGFMCRTRLERFGEGNVYPHEETHATAKADRLRLWRECRANLSQIFGLYPDDDNQVQDRLEEAVRGATPIEATDHLSVRHRLWPVTDVEVIGQVAAGMGSRPLFIADGHHRYETACTYRDEVLQASGGLSPEHPANFVLTMCVSMSDPGMLVLPTHRLFRGLPAFSSGDLAERLGECFVTEPAGHSAAAAPAVWEAIAAAGDQERLAFYTRADEQWTLARLTDSGRQRFAEIAPQQSPAWRGLGVAILHRLVMDHLLGAESAPAPKYVRQLEEVVEGLRAGDTAGRDATGQQGGAGHFPLAALTMPASIDHIQQLSESGERMPAKSTYFYPKLLSGLVINPLA